VFEIVVVIINASISKWRRGAERGVLGKEGSLGLYSGHAATAELMDANVPSQVSC
jgi:hypothetical protein